MHPALTVAVITGYGLTLTSENPSHVTTFGAAVRLLEVWSLQADFGFYRDSRLQLGPTNGRFTAGYEKRGDTSMIRLEIGGTVPLIEGDEFAQAGPIEILRVGVPTNAWTLLPNSSYALFTSTGGLFLSDGFRLEEATTLGVGIPYRDGAETSVLLQAGLHARYDAARWFAKVGADVVLAGADHDLIGVRTAAFASGGIRIDRFIEIEGTLAMPLQDDPRPTVGMRIIAGY